MGVQRFFLWIARSQHENGAHDAHDHPNGWIQLQLIFICSSFIVSNPGHIPRNLQWFYDLYPIGPLDHPSIEAASLIFFSNSAVKSSLRTRIPGWLLDSFERVLRTLRILRIFRTLRIFRILRILRNKKNCGPPLVYVILANELVGAAWPRGRALFSQRGSWGSHVHRTTGCWVFCVCCIYMYMYYIYTYMCVHIYIYAYIYTHTFTYSYMYMVYYSMSNLIISIVHFLCECAHIFVNDTCSYTNGPQWLENAFVGHTFSPYL